MTCLFGNTKNAYQSGNKVWCLSVCLNRKLTFKSSVSGSALVFSFTESVNGASVSNIHYFHQQSWI